MIIPRILGEWKPDAPDLANDGLITAKGCYPSAQGYSPFWDAETTGLSVTGTVLGAKRFQRTDGSEVLTVGTNTDLYVITGGSVTASSLSMSSINAADDAWQFEQFGSAVYATIKSVDSDQAATYYLTDIDTDTTFSTSPGTPPHGNCMARVDDFLILGNIADIDDSDQPFRIRWSAFNNPQETWTTDIALQSGFVDMPEAYGKVTGISGGEIGLILQERAVSRIDYVGGSTAFQKVLIAPNTGCESPSSVVTLNGFHYWLSNEGFMRSDGAAIDNLSAGRVWDWFLESANTEKLNKVQGAINWDRRCIVWNCYQVDTTAYNLQMIYNWESNQWSYAVETIDWLVPVTYDGSFSEGDPRLRRILGGFQSGTLYELSGDAVAAEFLTGEFELNPGQRSFVRSIRPMIENVDNDTSASVRYRNLPGEAVTESASTEEGALGFVPTNVDSRYFAVKMNIPAAANWDKAHGVLIDADPSGWT